MEKIDSYLKPNEKILWKKCKIFNYYLDSIKEVMFSLVFILVPSALGIYALIMFIITFNFIQLGVFIFLVVILLVPFVILSKNLKEMKRQRTILPKNELKNYKYCSIITNMRYIHKHLKNLEKAYVAQVAITISDHKDDIFSVNLDNIKMVGVEYMNDKECELYLFSKIDFSFPLTLYIELTLQELINAVKILNDLLHFEQEEHHIYGGIIYLRSKQTIPKNFENFFKTEKNNIKPVSDVIKTNK